MSEPPRTWKLMLQLWERLVEESENEVWTGSLTAIFKEWDERPNQSRVMKGLRLLDRVHTIDKGPPTVLKLVGTRWPLRIEEYNEKHELINEVKGRRDKTRDALLEQRVADLAATQFDLLVRVEALEERMNEFNQ